MLCLVQESRCVVPLVQTGAALARSLWEVHANEGAILLGGPSELEPTRGPERVHPFFLENLNERVGTR